MLKSAGSSHNFSIRFCAISWLLVVIAGCTINITRYTDGPLSEYLLEPIPQLNEPIAQSLSLEKITFQTAASLKGTMISDLVAREIYVMPESVGAEVKAVMNLDQAYSEDATYEALNVIARNRDKARHMWSGQSSQTITSVQSSSGYSQPSGYIQRQESMASEAYSKDDYLGGNIHSSAAESAIRIQQSAEQTQATVDMVFGTLNAMAAVGEGMIKDEFLRLRNWIEFESGAIGETAPQGAHLSVFFLRFFDAKRFQLDSRNRVAVYMVLTDIDGNSISRLEGSDILNCEGECNLFQPKPSAKILETTQHSTDVQNQLWTADGRQNLDNNGFDTVSGIYQYLLLTHGLQQLGDASRAAAAGSDSPTE